MENIDKELLKEIWNKAEAKYNKIIEKHNIKNSYISPKAIELSDYKSLADKIAFHLQNGFNKSKIINYEKNKKVLLKIFIDKYKDKSAQSKNEKLICEIYKEIEKNIDTKNSEKTWKQYIEGNLDFMFLYKSDNNYIKKLIRKINEYYKDYQLDNIVKEVCLFSNKIKGLGLALACDTLKELGCTSLGKPDTHLINIFKTIRKNAKMEEKQCLIDILTMAKEVNKTPYYVDKVFWLLSTGNFYDEELLNYRRKDLIKDINETIKNINKKK